MKRYLALLLVLVMTGALAGCQVGASGEPPAKQEEPTQSASVSVVEPEPIPEESMGETSVDGSQEDEPQPEVSGAYLLLDAEDAYEGAYTFVAEDTGLYEFECFNQADYKDVSWDIYVLDKEFDDAMRFLGQAYEPAAVITDGIRVQCNISADQFVYCVCSRNAWTDDSVENMSKLIVWFTAGLVPKETEGDVQPETQEYTVDGCDLYETGGWYTVPCTADATCNVQVTGGEDVEWSFYVTEQPFEDALRFLPQEQPAVLTKAGSFENDFPVKAGEYVYCYCSVNGFTADEPLAEGEAVLHVQLTP